jgi:ketosteroid isomerase-like protein
MVDFPSAPHSQEQAALRAAERSLQDALVAADVPAIDALLDDRVRFLGPDGITIGKLADLAAHRSGELRFDSLTELAHETDILDGIGITRVVVRFSGRAAGTRLDGVTMAYTRVWSKENGVWRVVAAQGALVA